MLESSDKLWVHFCKERFPNKRKTKLMPRGDSPFQVLMPIGGAPSVSAIAYETA